MRGNNCDLVPSPHPSQIFTVFVIIPLKPSLWLLIVLLVLQLTALSVNLAV
jgi:hypothetical protein